MRIAINGFGRIGRMSLRMLLQKTGIEVIAINDLADIPTLAHLYMYDSVHGQYQGSVEATADSLVIDGKPIRILSERDPLNLPWADMDIDLVLEATGKFTSRKAAELHLQAGARQVIVSAPSSDKDIPTIVLGVNDHLIDLTAPILSNASCTTNNVAPMVKVLDDNWGIKDGYITTVHSMTGDQNLHDAPHRDLRRARAASASIIPTSTGAAKAITSIFPHLEGKMGGAGIRVPVLNGSLTDFTCTLKKQPGSVAEINAKFKEAAATSMKGVLKYTEAPIVSIDVVDNPYSCTFDALLTSIVGDLVKVVGWYDNEFGYSNRLADLVGRIAELKHHETTIDK
ncbi:type I glyceraldehyde-3-phosphate dehydrogenase [Chitinophaga flava]|uniref:Type I glyceraldehyde-3-phosphate dehydrogenase n=2 Tax=Chitinophaga flava TaxID=2259036 RepID=A0A365XSZ5_9BACT|nr:type I glyceraldehyde-3-phosphate dehydrogenase [Chitinophaga flava]RBL89496.1 type I glyceraldehyde-3-phosphate dehydrogenase [Chitinophaga flava]